MNTPTRPAMGIATMVLTLWASPALAHTGGRIAGGLAGGLAHPLFGPDHMVTMVAVGLWGAFLGTPAIWPLPIVFPIVMAFGGVMGILGITIPGLPCRRSYSA